MVLGYRLSLIDVITSFASFYTNIVKLITIWVRRSYLETYLGQVNRNTRFTYFTDKRI